MEKETKQPLKVSRGKDGIWRVKRGDEVLVEHLTKIAANESKSVIEQAEAKREG